MKKLTLFFFIIVGAQSLYGANQNGTCSNSHGATLEELLTYAASTLRACKNTGGRYPGVVFINKDGKTVVININTESDGPSKLEVKNTYLMTAATLTLNNNQQFGGKQGHTSFVLAIPEEGHYPNAQDVPHEQIEQFLTRFPQQQS